MNAAEAAVVVEAEIREWFGMGEKQTQAAVARAIASMPDTAKDLDALRRVAQSAYREVMLTQAIQLARMEIDLAGQGAHRFVDRATEALRQVVGVK